MLVLGEIAPLAKHGRPTKEQSLKGCNTTFTQRGTVEYTLRRLKRDAPESQDPNSDLDPLMTLEVIPAADHFQNGWKSKIHFQRLATGCTDDVASGVSSKNHIGRNC